MTTYWFLVLTWCIYTDEGKKCSGRFYDFYPTKERCEQVGKVVSKPDEVVEWKCISLTMDKKNMVN